MSDMSIDSLTLTSAATAMRAGQLSATELLGAMVARYRAVEPRLNAWVELFEQDVLPQAMAADRRLRANSTAPLLGIPIGIKDIFDVAGKPTRCNSQLRADAPPAPRDAETVHRLRKAGALLLGKTVTQEFAAGVVSAPARNPWNPDRVPGGSSGGSAAAVSAAMALGGLGSDTGGSIRIPAAVTGTVGLKPTYGRIDLTGTFPLSPSLDTPGPITRTVADAVAMYLALANRHREVLASIERFGELASVPSLKGVRIGVLRGFFAERVQIDVAAALEAAVRQLGDLGAELVELDWPLAEAARVSALLISRVESAAVHYHALRDRPELMGDDVRYRFETGALLPGVDYLRARQARVAARESIQAVFEANRLDAVVAPTTPAVAPRVDRLVATYPDGSSEPVGTALTRFTMPWNATGQPVISVPCGFDRDGLPIGLSFVGLPDEEIRLAEVAQHFEQAAGWHQRRPPVIESAEGNGNP